MSDKYPDVPGHVAGSDTSEAAADSMIGPAVRKRLQAYEAIAEAGKDGLTCDELEHVTSMSHQTASARIRELAMARRVADSGRRRNTRSGRKAVVWVKL